MTLSSCLKRPHHEFSTEQRARSSRSRRVCVAQFAALQRGVSLNCAHGGQTDCADHDHALRSKARVGSARLLCPIFSARLLQYLRWDLFIAPTEQSSKAVLAVTQVQALA